MTRVYLSAAIIQKNVAPRNATAKLVALFVILNAITVCHSLINKYKFYIMVQWYQYMIFFVYDFFIPVPVFIVSLRNQ